MNATPSTLRVPLDSIDAGTNVRDLDAAHVDRLARSIELRGLLAPLTVRPIKNGYALVAGWHRHAACRKLGLAEVDVLARDQDASSGDTAAENILRKNLTPLGEAKAVGQMISDGYTPEGAAQALGWSPQLVSARAKILTLSEQAQALLDSGSLPVSAVDTLLTIAKVSPALCDATTAAIANDTVDGRRLVEDPAWTLGAVLRDAGKPFGAYLRRVNAYEVAELRLGKKSDALLKEATEICHELDRYAYGAAAIDFSDLEVDQARAAGVLLEFDRGAPIITDRPLYRELVKQAIARTTEELRATKEERAAEKAARRKSGQKDRTPVQQLEADHRAEMRELTRRGHGTNLELGAALRRDLAKVDPADINVARFFAYAALGRDPGGFQEDSRRNVIDAIAANGIRLVLDEQRETTTPTLKTGKPGKTTITYGDPKDATKWLWRYIDGAKTAGDLYGRVLTVFACQHYAEQSVLPASKRRHSVVPASHNDVARKAFVQITKGAVPPSHKQLQSAMKRAVTNYEKASHELIAKARAEHQEETDQEREPAED